MAALADEDRCWLLLVLAAGGGAVDEERRQALLGWLAGTAEAQERLAELTALARDRPIPPSEDLLAGYLAEMRLLLLALVPRSWPPAGIRVDGVPSHVRVIPGEPGGLPR